MGFEDWDDLRILLAVAREHTLTGASRRLRVDQTTVSRRLKALEERSGHKIFERLRGGVVFTVAGEALCETARIMELAVIDFERRAAGSQLALAGPLCVTLPELMAHVWIGDFIEFSTTYPDVALQIKCSDDIHDLTRREADVALRVTANPASHLVGRKLGPMATAIYGAPRWLDVTISSVPWVGWSPANQEQSMTTLTRRRIHSTAPFTLWCDSYMLMMDAARAGSGALVLPCITGDREPGLTRLEPPQELPMPIWALTHEDLRDSPRVRAMLDALSSWTARDAEALRGNTHIMI